MIINTLQKLGRTVLDAFARTGRGTGWFGDVLGHQVATGARGALGQLRQAAATFEEWTGEHLRQPEGPLAQVAQIGEFSAAVDALRDATNRLEARLRILRERAGTDESGNAE